MIHTSFWSIHPSFIWLQACLSYIPLSGLNIMWSSSSITLCEHMCECKCVFLQCLSWELSLDRSFRRFRWKCVKEVFYWCEVETQWYSEHWPSPEEAHHTADLREASSGFSLAVSSAGMPSKSSVCFQAISVLVWLLKWAGVYCLTKNLKVLAYRFSTSFALWFSTTHSLGLLSSFLSFRT